MRKKKKGKKYRYRKKKKRPGPRCVHSRCVRVRCSREARARCACAACAAWLEFLFRTLTCGVPRSAEAARARRFPRQTRRWKRRGWRLAQVTRSGHSPTLCWCVLQRIRVMDAVCERCGYCEGRGGAERPPGSWLGPRAGGARSDRMVYENHNRPASSSPYRRVARVLSTHRLLAWP